MINRVTGGSSESGDSGSGGDSGNGGDSGGNGGNGGETSSDIDTWLQTQFMPSHDDDCIADFRITVVDGAARLFHGHDCGYPWNYILTS